MAKDKGTKSEKPKKAGTRTFDFSDVKEMGNFRPKRKPEGDYKAKITAVEEGTSSKGNEQWTFTIELTSDKTAVYPYYCGFDAKQVFKIFNLCIAAGMEPPKKKVAINAQKLVGKLIGITLEDDEYNDKPKSRISAVCKVSELTDEEPTDDEDEPEDDEDEVDTDDESDDTEDDEDDSDDEEEDSDEEDDDSDDDDEEDEEEDDTEDEDEEEDEEPEPEPELVKKKKKAAEPEPAKKKKAAPVEEPKKAKKSAEVTKPSKKGTKAAKSGKKSIDLDDL